MDYTITLTDTEKKCMDYVTSDIDEWITNAAQSRAYVAKQEILAANTEYCNNNSIATVSYTHLTLPTNREV